MEAVSEFATPEFRVDAQWSDVLHAYHSVSGQLEHALQSGHGLGMSDFELLKILSKSCGKAKNKILMKDLEAQMYLSQSAFSRTVTRLEKAGLVERGACDNDRRSNFLAITSEGCDLLDAAGPTYRAVLSKHFA
ncbi:MarR family winged helix-turn-helix transcriptional regulator [Myceligenerans crystallogenes]|uniref:HTH marR-type domain-containing protein n=1 Tax=Myceligenerans crystallogenes TaxID=316335 RepID=A0ABN2N6X5_9MICO